MIYRQSSLDGGSWSALCNTITSLLAVCATFTNVAAKTAADYYVKDLPGAPDGPLLRMHAGHIEITPEHNGNLFFWHYANKHIADRPRTVIWLNGGPGCSSEDGALMEVGPYRVGKGGKLHYNDGSWDEFANLLFVDNPVGTGFSYVNGDSYLHELQEMADNFIIFLEKFFEIFPEYESDDLYLSGESYAGQHLPYIAKAILDRNNKAEVKLVHTQAEWKLKGVLIGNGWISSIEQYQSYTTFAYEAGLLQGGTKDAERVERVLADCLKELNKPGAKEKVNINKCESVLTTILDVTKKNDQCPNMYDVRLTDSYPSCGMNWPPDLAEVTPYLRQQTVTDALHVNRDKREGWSECSGAVSSSFRAVNSKSSITLLPGLLEAGLPILLFAGDKDMICNHIGVEDLIANMKWSGGTGLETSPGTWAPKRDWEFEGEPAGIYQEARNLTYVKFYNSSHMVPFDYPRRSRDMLDRFMGVDIASIGGKPTDSRIDGEKAGSETSVGGHTNSTAAAEDEKKKISAATYKAYYRSGEAALVVVIIAAIIWGWWVWRSRRKGGGRGLGNYMSIPTMNGSSSGLHNKDRSRDVEAGDFDEGRLETLSSEQIRRGGETGVVGDHEPYDLADDSDDDDDDEADLASKELRSGQASRS